MKKVKLILCGILLFGCTKKEGTQVISEAPQAQEVAKEPVPSPKVSSPPAEPVLVPELADIQVNYSMAAFKNNFYYLEDLEIIEPRSSFLVHSYSQRIWGPVPTKIGDVSVEVFLKRDKTLLASIKYHSPSHEVIQKKVHCENNKKPSLQADYKAVLAELDKPKADGESLIEKLSALAEMGSPEAIGFFTKPTEVQKKYSRFNDGAASFEPVRTRIAFLKELGCLK